jgi:uncharacterized SAM-binding protein YcdF (DUF218 family)
MKKLPFKRPLIAVILIPVLVYVSIGIYAGVNVYKRPSGSADAVIILGARSYFGDKINPCLAARVDEGARLIKDGKAKYVIVSGGVGDSGLVESETMAKLLTDRDVKKDQIILESQATSTHENLLYSREIMNDRDFTNVIIVTEPFHIPRADLIADKLGIDHELSSANSSPCWSRWKWASRYFLREPLVMILYKLQGKI